MLARPRLDRRARRAGEGGRAVATYSIRFFVPGVPIGQGSKTFVPTKAGPRSRESNEARLRPWRSSIVDKAAELVDAPIRGPVVVRVVFYFPRPKTHFRTGRFADQLRDDAPFWHTTTPDADKLVRALGDALSSVVVGDDKQIAYWNVRKLYSERPGALIEVESLDAEYAVELGLEAHA